MKAKGYLVDFRLVKASHDHVGITIWVRHNDEAAFGVGAKNREEAEKVAWHTLRSAQREGHGVESVEYVYEVEIEQQEADDA